MRQGLRRLIGIVVAGTVVLAVGLPTSAGATSTGTAAAAASAAAPSAALRLAVAKATKHKPAATLTATASTLGSGKVKVRVTSNAKKVTLQYRTSKNKKRSTTIKIRKGKGSRTLARKYRPVRAYARATSKLAKSGWVAVGGVTAVPVPVGRSYTIGPDSPILAPMAKYSTVNSYTRHYYLIRSYMHRFEAAGGGELTLLPGRYEISSTIYVPSNTTIRLSAGTTLVKSDKTGTSKFSASSSMFMLIRPSLGKVSGAVGGHDGDANITIAGAGAGRSVIDMASIYNTLAIIAGHNRNLTISGITFEHMNNNHFIELDACADCTIAGNEFLDAAGGTRETAEAINLDTPDPATKGFGSVWSKQDATPNERVTIAGNRFDGLQRAFGTHNFSAGRYHTGIVVRDNTITNDANDAIQIMNWADPVFTGNAISSRAVGIRACGTRNPTITGNTFSESSSAVVFRSCNGENGTTAGNVVSADNVAALRANAVGAGLGSASVAVPDFGTVWFTGHEPPPNPPSSVSPAVTIGDGKLVLTWSTPSADERAPVTGYLVALATSSSGPAVRSVELAADATSTEFAGLTNGTPYYVSITAHSGAGDSYAWWQGPVTPLTAPGVPTNVVAAGYTGGVQLSWSGPAGTVAGSSLTYKVYVFTNATGTVPMAGSPFSTYSTYWSTGGLASGQKVWLQVSAVNSAGEGPATARYPATVG